MRQYGTSCTECDNNECFIKKCKENWIEKLSKAKSEIIYKKDNQIIVEGHPVMGLYFVKKGKVKIISTGIGGKQQIVRLAKTGHVIGHKGSSSEVYPIGAVAIEDSSICFIDNTLIFDTLMHNPEFTIALMMFYSNELRKVETRLKYSGQMTVREKVAEAILFINDIFGTDARQCLDAPFLRQDIADLAGTNQEQVVRQLSEFENEGLLSKKGRKIELLNLDGIHNVISSYPTYY